MSATKLYLVEHRERLIDDEVVVRVGQHVRDSLEELVEVHGSVSVLIPSVPFTNDVRVEQVLFFADAKASQQAQELRKRNEAVSIEIKVVECFFDA